MDPLNRQQLRPIEYPGLVRLGPPEDGGYIVPQAQALVTPVLLSLGVSEDWSFDRAVLAINPKVRVIGVDHSVGPAYFVRRMGFYALKLLGYILIFHRRKIRDYA